MEPSPKARSAAGGECQFLATAERIYLILAYPKSVKDSLTPAEKAKLKPLTRQLKGEVSE
ncbi:MAG: type II toxin-antitoxin system RelE/ParE family toxin [Pseudomonadota bacterium]